jgi:hypothetical protein
MNCFSFQRCPKKISQQQFSNKFISTHSKIGRQTRLPVNNKKNCPFFLSFSSNIANFLSFLSFAQKTERRASFKSEKVFRRCPGSPAEQKSAAFSNPEKN